MLRQRFNICFFWLKIVWIFDCVRYAHVILHHLYIRNKATLPNTHTHTHRLYAVDKENEQRRKSNNKNNNNRINHEIAINASESMASCQVWGIFIFPFTCGYESSPLSSLGRSFKLSHSFIKRSRRCLGNRYFYFFLQNHMKRIHFEMRHTTQTLQKYIKVHI